MKSSGSKSLLNKGNGKETLTWRDDAELFRILRKEVVQKCFIDREVLRDNDTFVVKATFYGGKKENTIMCLPKSMLALQKQEECMKVFTSIGLDQFFQMPPCDVDVKRCHKLLMMLQEDGTCMLSDLEGEPMELNLMQDIVTRALKI